MKAGTQQTQDVANLSRDTTNTNGTVSATPDVQNLLNQQADTMQAAQAAGQVVAQGIGAYADSKRDTAIENAKAAEARGDTQAAQGYWSEAQSWADDGSNRIALHIAGGGLIGGLGGGGIGSAAGGAAAAGLTSYLAGQSRAIANSVEGETGSEIAGKVVANVLATLGGGLVGGTAGAATASNVNLYNQWNDKSGAYADEQIAQAMGETGSKRPSLLELALMGIANGLNAIVGMGGGKPPAASPGAVVVDSAVGQAAGAGISSSGNSLAGYGVGNTTLNSGNGGDNSRQANPSKADSPVWQGLNSAGNGVKTDGKLFYEWDYTHNDIEVYNKRGVHLGSMDPVTGDMYKDAVPGRKLNNR